MKYSKTFTYLNILLVSEKTISHVQISKRQVGKILNPAMLNTIPNTVSKRKGKRVPKSGKENRGNRPRKLVLKVWFPSLQLWFNDPNCAFFLNGTLFGLFEVRIQQLRLHLAILYNIFCTEVPALVQTCKTV